MLSTLLALYARDILVTGGLPYKGPIIRSVGAFCCWPQQIVDQTIKLSVIWDAMAFMQGHYNLYQTLSLYKVYSINNYTTVVLCFTVVALCFPGRVMWSIYLYLAGLFCWQQLLTARHHWRKWAKPANNELTLSAHLTHSFSARQIAASR